MKCKDCKFAKPSGFYCEDAKLFVDKTGSCNKGEKRQDGWEVVRQIYRVATNPEHGCPIPKEFILSEKDELIVDEEKTKEFCKGFNKCYEVIAEYINNFQAYLGGEQWRR